MEIIVLIYSLINAQHFLFVSDNGKKLKKPKPWKHTQAITPAQLRQMRDEFWDTAPHYGGQKGTLYITDGSFSFLLSAFISESVMHLYCMLDHSFFPTSDDGPV